MIEVKIISLKDEKSKELARALSNKTAQEILHQLTKLKSVKHIAEELNLPLTTVQSNIKNLEKVGLVEQTHYKWSPKGRKQRLYQPAKNIIIFAPEKAHANIIEVLKNNVVLPILMMIAGGVGLISRLSNLAEIKAINQAEQVMAASSLGEGQLVMSISPAPSLHLIIIFGALIVIGIIWLIYSRLRK